MSTWRILEWSREHGRGAIAGLHFDRVEFDASRADVDDFVIGELVHVEIEGSGPELRVRRVRPDLPRFPANHGENAAPPLDGALRAEAEAAVAAASDWMDVRVVLGATAVRLELDDDNFAYGPGGVLELIAPTYVEVPTAIEARFIQLAGPAMRSYLATRMALSSEDIAVAIIDEADRFFFVVARGIAFTRLR
jgi:hypothetical protein